MTKSSVAVVGNNRLAQDLVATAAAAGIAAAQLGDLEAVAAASQLVIDADSGSEEAKRSRLQRLDALAPTTVIVSACLGFTVTEMASWITRPERLVGFATFYPLKDRKLIELAGGLKTTEAPIAQTEEFFKSIDKETLRVKDAPGLTFPRILSLIVNEAARSLEEGVATAEEIDVAMRLGVNYPQGPLKWADQIGLNEVLAVLDGLRRNTGDDRYRPAPLLRKLVAAGFIGETSGRGFYNYREGR
jgi:3-hydroxybutyryl-CoA dehydrogenase